MAASVAAIYKFSVWIGSARSAQDLFRKPSPGLIWLVNEQPIHPEILLGLLAAGPVKSLVQKAWLIL